MFNFSLFNVSFFKYYVKYYKVALKWPTSWHLRKVTCHSRIQFSHGWDKLHHCYSYSSLTDRLDEPTRPPPHFQMNPLPPQHQKKLLYKVSIKCCLTAGQFNIIFGSNSLARTGRLWSTGNIQNMALPGTRQQNDIRVTVIFRKYSFWYFRKDSRRKKLVWVPCWKWGREQDPWMQGGLWTQASLCFNPASRCSSPVTSDKSVHLPFTCFDFSTC